VGLTLFPTRLQVYIVRIASEEAIVDHCLTYKDAR
jgi:hypothetical protein